MLDYTIWRTNKFNSELKQEVVAKFGDFEKAKQFVDFEAEGAERFVITKDNKIIYGLD